MNKKELIESIVTLENRFVDNIYKTNKIEIFKIEYRNFLNSIGIIENHFWLKECTIGQLELILNKLNELSLKYNF